MFFFRFHFHFIFTSFLCGRCRGGRLYSNSRSTSSWRTLDFLTRNIYCIPPLGVNSSWTRQRLQWSRSEVKPYSEKKVNVKYNCHTLYPLKFQVLMCLLLPIEAVVCLWMFLSWMSWIAECCIGGILLQLVECMAGLWVDWWRLRYNPLRWAWLKGTPRWCTHAR